MPAGEDNLAVAALPPLSRGSRDPEKGFRGNKKRISPSALASGEEARTPRRSWWALNRLLGKFADRDLLWMGASLGADVPFFVRSASSFVEGVGEKVRVLSDFPAFSLRHPFSPEKPLDPGGLPQVGAPGAPSPKRSRSRFSCGAVPRGGFPPWKTALRMRCPGFSPKFSP